MFEPWETFFLRNIPQEVVPPLAHAEREDECAIHVLELKGGVPKHVENYRAVLSISVCTKFDF